MKLVKVRLRNFRCYLDEVEFEIGNLTALIGRNDCGKSSLLEALAIFFADGTPDADDASKHGKRADMRVVCEFDEFPDALVLDADHPTTLGNEYLLNEDGRLEIHRTYDGALQKPKATGTYARALHPSARGFEDLLILRNAELKARAKEMGVDLTGVDVRVNTMLRRAIWAAADDLRCEVQDVDLGKESAKQVWAQLLKYLPAYALFKSDRASTDQDDEAQDPMKAAVKEAIKARAAELGAIEEYVRTEVEDIARRTVQKLREMDPALAGELSPRFQAPKWDSVFRISLTGEDEVPINKRGSGVRRLILLNFFRAKAEEAATTQEAPSVVYAFEEPETSQHPANQRMLMRSFEELSQRPDCQIILTTHTPVLARLLPVEALRYVRIEQDGGRAVVSGEAIGTTVARDLGVLADHDVRLFIGVEGVNDIAFIIAMSRLLRPDEAALPDLEALEQSGEIMFIPVGGSNVALWVSRLAALHRPEFHLFDRDVPPPADAPKQRQVEEICERENCHAILTDKREIENYVHHDAIRAAYAASGVHLNLSPFADFDDVPALVAQAVHQAAGTEKPWNDLSRDEMRKKESAAKAMICRVATEHMTIDRLDDVDRDGDVRTWLRTIAQLLR